MQEPNLIGVIEDIHAETESGSLKWVPTNRGFRAVRLVGRANWELNACVSGGLLHISTDSMSIPVRAVVPVDKSFFTLLQRHTTLKGW